MGISISSRPLHWLHPTAHGIEKCQRLALTGPRGPFHYTRCGGVPDLHQPSDLSANLLVVGHGRASRGNNRGWKSWTRIHGRTGSFPVSTWSNGARSAHHLPKSLFRRLTGNSITSSRF